MTSSNGTSVPFDLRAARQPRFFTARFQECFFASRERKHRVPQHLANDDSFAAVRRLGVRRRACIDHAGGAASVHASPIGPQ